MGKDYNRDNDCRYEDNGYYNNDNGYYGYYDYKCYKGQPIQVLARSGMKYCGILVSYEGNGIDLIDCKGRTVHVEKRHIEAIVEPRMKLQRLCGHDDCCCKDHHDDDDCCCDF